MQYDDFVLQLDLATGGGGYVSRVLRSPAGEAEAPFVNPLTPADLRLLWSEAEQTRRRGRRGAGLIGDALGRPPLSVEEMGSRLFAAAFAGPVRSCWARSLAGIAVDPDRGLRLKLQLSLDEPRLAPLHEIPWEILFSPEQGGFLGLRRQTPVLRHVRLPLPTTRAPAARPLRLLLVSAEPSDMQPLSLAGEVERIREALHALPGVEPAWLSNPTVEELRETALRNAPHVLHFMGHGGFDATSGQGALHFTSPGGTAITVRGDLLASQLADVPSLRLIFLNACETARASAPAPFAGVATALLRSGIPAVVAMQLPIRDEAALAFSRTVYRRLAAGDPVDTAVSEGRLAIARDGGESHEWSTPVLFLRAEDGRLFETGTAGAEPLALPRTEPAGGRSRPWPRAGLVAASLAIAAVGGWTGYLNLGSPVPVAPAEATHKAEPAPSITETPEPPAPSPSPSPLHEEKRSEAGDRDAALPPVSSLGEPSGHKDPPIEPIVTPPSRSSARVTADSPVTVAGVEVGVRFFERDGFPFARFSLAPPDGAMLQQPPVMGTGTIDFRSDSGTYHLDVQTLDHGSQSATVRVRFSPA